MATGILLIATVQTTDVVYSSSDPQKQIDMPENILVMRQD